MENKLQFRSSSFNFETREDGENPVIEGYFSVFNTTYDMGFDMSESVAPGLWHVIHPGERIVRSHADLIWNCLYEEGIYANLTVHDMNSPTYYENAEDAVSEYVRRLCAETDEQKDIVRWYIVSRILKTPNGYMLPDDGKYAHIWWDTV